LASAIVEMSCLLQRDMRWQQRHFWIGLYLEHDRKLACERLFPGRSDTFRTIDVDSVQPDQFGEA
jgi:putative methionine-R-sulfoxide reductase with GAF domain